MNEHTITPPSGRQLGYVCTCGQKFTNKAKADNHIQEEITKQLKVEVVSTENEDGSLRSIEFSKPGYTNIDLKTGEVEVTEAPRAKEKPMEEVKPPTPAIAKEMPKTLVPIQRVQQDVIKFASKMMSQERATEYATRVALIARENPKIAQAINKNPDAFLASYMASATLDLMPNTPEQLAFIIPYGDKVQFQVGYRGLLQLARRSGEVMRINAELVLGGDDFDVQFGTERKIVHKPDFSINRTDYTKVTHAYATARLTNGEDQFVVMTKDELNKVQKSAASGEGPWKSWPERMALKTVLKRLAQVLPTATDDDLRKAVAYDSLSEAGKLRFKEGEIIEGETVEVSQTTIDSINSAQTKEDIEDVLHSLSVDERKKAAPLAANRIKELA